ncbi:dihydroorotase [Garciella nitratireducens]|nr:dihydroorotase [Garciella nitratireducens]
MMKRLLIKGGRVLDTQTKTDGVLDILVENGIIVKIEENIPSENTEVIDARNLWVLPGLVDMHAHLREPGFEYKETIESGTKAAAAGGFTTIACMPNTNPVIDNAFLVEYIFSKIQKEGFVKVKPIGAVSKDLKGEVLAEIGDMIQAGAVAFSDDGHPISDTSLMKKAMEYASMWDKVIISHCEEPTLSRGGFMNEGKKSTILGMQAIPEIAEDIMVARDLILAQYTGCKVHIAHVSTKGSVEMIRQAKAKGVRVTCEVTPHHFSLTQEVEDGWNAQTKVNPPLRTKEDVEAILKGLQDGTIDAIATDHAPHHRDEKILEYALAPSGISGLETALPLAMTNLVKNNILTPLQLVEKMSFHPAKILDLDVGTLQIGKCADITIINPDKKEIVDKNEFYSKGKNTPFHGMELYGKVFYTIVEGKIVKNIETIQRGE